MSVGGVGVHQFTAPLIRKRAKRAIYILAKKREDFARLDALVVGATDARGVVMPYSNPLGSAKWGIVAPGGSGTRDGRDNGGDNGDWQPA